MTSIAPGPVRRFRPAYLIIALGAWGFAMTALISTVIILSRNPIHRAVILMADGLVLLWIVIGGITMYRLRDRIRPLVQRIPWDWRLKFILFCTLLALIEEAITTTMTNLAPLFGVPIGSAYITASANYLDVVCCHSVVVFVPMFVAWAMFLSRYDFSPPAVFLCFGFTGVLAETSFSGPQGLANAGFWVFVYGLMVYLPTCCIPRDRPVRTSRWWHYPLAVVVPFLFVIPVAGAIWFLHPVKIHFPPIQGN